MDFKTQFNWLNKAQNLITDNFLNCKMFIAATNSTLRSPFSSKAVLKMAPGGLKLVAANITSSSQERVF